MRSHHVLFPAALALTASAIKIPAGDGDALKLAAKQVSNGVLSFYTLDPTDSAGIFPGEYYWYEMGAAWDSLVNYWFLTGDSSHNDVVQTALTHQMGDRHDFMPSNQTKSEGNDDQSTWALAAMTAAERNLPTASSDRPAWVDVARNVFEEQAARWNYPTETCGGGLRWQIYSFNAGYNYKNTITQANFIQLAARLARFTGNQTYVDWAEKAYTWTETVGLIDTATYAVYDGTSVTNNCSNFDMTEWPYTAASLTLSTAILGNITSSPTWTTRTTSLLSHLLPTFFSNTTHILSPLLCTPSNSCDNDMLLMPAQTLRSLSLIPLYAPDTRDTLTPYIDATAAAAASKCTIDGEAAKCRGNWAGVGVADESGSKYVSDEVDGWGLGQQVGVLDAILGRMVGERGVVLVKEGQGNATESSGNGTATKEAGEASGTKTAESANGAESLRAAAWGVMGVVGMVGAWLL